MLSFNAKFLCAYLHLNTVFIMSQIAMPFFIIIVFMFAFVLFLIKNRFKMHVFLLNCVCFSVFLFNNIEVEIMGAGKSLCYPRFWQILKSSIFTNNFYYLLQLNKPTDKSQPKPATRSPLTL